MSALKSIRRRLILTIVLCLLLSGQVASQTSEVDRLVAAMLKETPIIADLQELCDEIGGRPTGSKANLESIEWALRKFKEAGVTAKKETFTMPKLWLGRLSTAVVSGDVSFTPNVAAMPFSAATPGTGLKAPLVDVKHGSEEDFTRVGDKAKGAFVFVETPALLDVEGLFREYIEAAAIEKRAFAAEAAGVVYMSSRPDGILCRHNASRGPDNKHPMLVMERGQAKRTLRLLRANKKLFLTAKIDIQTNGEYQSFNVIGEIPGSEKPDEFVVIGAHLDSWDLGTGANDNGCNVVLLIDIARQIKRLGIKPKRTIRFCLWNGEEQGIIGSWKYTRTHAHELAGHIMACSIDVGSGRILGFITGGREELIEPVNQALKPVEGLGPFQHIDHPMVGTDHYDFMMQGIATLVPNQAPANYGPNYHAASDTFDKVDLHQLKLNAAIMAALIYGFADMDVTWKRHTRAQIQQLIDTTDLKQMMETFGLYSGWLDGTRGISKEKNDK
ncbi:MAG: M20/M25/M40 family metallo-hydrolase [Candidatus Aminicenantes bacterium]|nr:M20/M25/M40 family metallo-hydrolase [Candidatus Aminicenantes bacterium]NIM80641.1 M20/M25/M40 family metallo-hydrolase [Candidatus Aminicenantes bacterium]NIN20022.1 M20/M25/M40 family metallo-hydrolase [Candidatus Aminicenantes bacterium]NIN43810.1 M20/M25/M40 family metallo-hydrolase [Candidatus Aminicenantes bacterium]NIN86620.1 M20/M25/M40 family metallo-hydrolase [Candidatus Aminicenantes bacterium]